MILAGIQGPAQSYLYDLFGDQPALDAVPSDKLHFLQAPIWQLALLGQLRLAAPLPDFVRRQLYGTGVVQDGESAEKWIGVLIRYREEWLKLMALARSRGLSWGNWLGERELVA